MWIGVNLFAGATICYVVLLVHYQPKPPRQSAASNSQDQALPNYKVVRRVNLQEKLTAHKHRVISQLRQSLLQQKVSSKHHTLNQARFLGEKKLKDLSPADVLCNLHHMLSTSNFQTLNSEVNIFPGVNHLLKRDPPLKKHYSSCAIVSSSGALLNSQLGEFIGTVLQ